jgi:outer membrane receptor for ferrienterochelin and colicins
MNPMPRLSASVAAVAIIAACSARFSIALAATPIPSAPLQTEIEDSHGHPWKHREVRLLSSDGTKISTTTTDDNGITRFQDVAPGKYIIEVPGASGAVTREDAAVTSANDATVSLITDTKPEKAASVPKNALEQITVTGVKATQPGALRGDIVMTESVDSGEMAKTGATSLVDALTHRPGIDIQIECSVCNIRSITLDNLPGRFTTLTLDGVPIFSPVSNAYGLDMLGVNGLERIDVSRGAGSSLTTPESLAGTVTLVTKVPTKDTAEIDADGGNFGYRREAVYGAKVFDWGAVSVNGTNQSHYSVDGAGYGISQFTGYHRELAGISLFFNDLDGFRIKFRYDHLEEKRAGGPLGNDYSAILANTAGNPFNWSAGPNGSPYPNTWIKPSTGHAVEPPYDGGEAGIANIIFTVRNQFVTTADQDFDGTKLHLALGYAQHEQSSWYGMDSNYWDNQHQVYLDANLQRLLGGALFTVGVNYKFEQLSSRSISTTPGTPYYDILRYDVDSYTYRTPGIYAQAYEAFFDERLEINASVREDDNNQFGSVTTPRINALWHHSATLSSRVALGTGYRLPTSFFEQDHGILSANTVDRSGARPERSQNASYSLNYADDRVTITTSLNHTRVIDMALFVNNSENNFVLEPAQHPFTVNNADLTGTWQATPSDAFTLGFEGYLYAFYAGDAYNAALFSRPKYRVSLGYDHDSGPWDFNIRSTLTGPQDLAKWYDYTDDPVYNLNGTPKPRWSPTFWVVDMHTSYAFNEVVSAEFGINNLTNYQQAKHDSYLFQDPYGNLNVTYIWGPNIGRSFIAGVKVEF